MAGPPAKEPAASEVGAEDLVHIGCPYVVSISYSVIRKPNASGFSEVPLTATTFDFNDLSALTDRMAVRRAIPFGGRAGTK